MDCKFDASLKLASIFSINIIPISSGRTVANAIIKRTNLHKSLFDMAEEIMDEIGVTNKENRKIIHEMTKAMFNKEVDRDKLEEFIQTNCSMMEQ